MVEVFPGSERLRYLIPFGDAASRRSTIWREIAEQHPDAVVVFGDDGEKFGTWPETQKHVYDDGWLERFFDALVANQDWIQTDHAGRGGRQRPPVGKIYLPDSSYREMTEWALPAEQIDRVRAARARDGGRSAAGRR